LNFSIAYGKTAHGLSKDWGVTVDEANELLAAWVKDRPEVKDWQDKVIRIARRTMYTRTLMGRYYYVSFMITFVKSNLILKSSHIQPEGRYRKLPDINSKDRSLRGHMERAAINTPIQGGEQSQHKYSRNMKNNTLLTSKLCFLILVK
jgi:DNA polymerase-1